MKRLIPTLIMAGLILASAVPAAATFPGTHITLWDPHFAKHDREDPEYLQVHAFVNEKKLDEAMSLVNRLIAERPTKGTPRIMKALLLYEMGRYRDAHEMLLIGRSIQPRHPAIHYANCQVYRHMGMVDHSDRGCKIAVHQHSEEKEAHYEYAQTLAAMGDMTSANRELALAAKLDPTHSPYFYEQGMNYFYLNDLKGAEEAFSRARELDPKNPDILYQLGYLYTLKKDFPKAETVLKESWESRSNHPKVESARKLLELIRKGRTDELPQTIIPHQYHLSRSRSLYQSGKYGLSLFEIQTAGKLKPDDKAIQEIRVGLSSLLLRLNLTEESIHSMLEHFKEDTILQAKSYQELGDIFAMRANWPEARKYYQKSVKLGDPDDLAKISLAELPKDSVNKPSPLKPDELFYLPAEALNRKGEIFSHFGMHQRALAVYTVVLRMNPMHLMSKLNTASVYYNTEQYGRAISVLEKIFMSHPNHSYILSHHILLAKCYAQKGDEAGAVKNLEIVKSAKPAILNSLKKDPAFSKIADHKIFQ